MRKEHAKHGRDHGPNGMDPIPGLGCYWAHVDSYGGTTVSTATDYTVAWDNFRTNKHLPGDPPSFTSTGFYTYTSGGGYNASGDTGLAVQGYGVAVITASVRWGATGTPVTSPKVKLSYVTADDTGTLAGGYKTAYLSDTTDFKQQYIQHVVVLPQWSDSDYGNSTDIGVRSIELIVRHEDGASRTMAWANMVVVLLPPSSSTYDLVFGTALV